MRANLPPKGYYLEPHVTVRAIQEAVSRSFRIRLFEMTSDRRAWGVARPRQVAMYLSRELTPYSLPNLGRFFGQRDHTTIMHGIKQVENRMAEDAALRRRIRSLKRRLLSTKKRNPKCADSIVRRLAAEA